MPEFKFKARDARGSDQQGKINASTRNAATAELKSRSWIVLSVEPVAPLDEADDSSLGSGKWLPARPPSAMQVETALQQLALMLRSGMTLLSSVDSLARQSSARSLAKTWREVSESLQRGSDLNQSLAAHKCFPEFVIRQVQIGEKTGNLDTVLRRSVDSMRQWRTTREAFVSATFYPLLVTALSIAVTVYMIAYLIPKLDIYLQSLGQEMPAMTQSLLDGSGWVRDNALAIAAIGLGLFVAAAVVYNSPEGRLQLDRLSLRIPVVGKLIRLRETFGLAQSLSTMLTSGITLVDGLGAVQPLLQNRHLAGIIDQSRQKIIQGQNLADAIDQTPGFTSMLIEMIQVGQQSGELSAVLSEVAELHQQQFQMYLKRLNSVLSPLLTIGIGGVVGYVYIAFFMALLAAGA